MSSLAPLVEPVGTGVPQPAVSTGPTALFPLWAAVLLALAAGPVSSAAYPDTGWWPCILVGVGVFLLALIGRRPWPAALVGFCYGMSFYVVHIFWATVFLGPIPMAALAFAMALGHAIGAVLIALGYRWFPQRWRGTVGRLLLLPIGIAGLWTAREAVASVWPFGGFAWGRVGQAMIDAPIAKLYAWVGISGMTFLVVLLIAMTIEAIRLTGVSRLQRAIAPVGVLTALVVWPAWPVPQDGSIRVGIVQGDGKAGYFEAAQRRPGDLLAAQYDATVPLFGRTDLDAVLWPEGSSEWDPQVDPFTAKVWSVVTEQTHAPLIGQAEVDHGPDDLTNSLILWDDDHALDEYDKRHPVPMGEYVPLRPVFHALAPKLIDMIGRDYAFGRTDAVMDIPTSSGPVRTAVNICYDIVDDGLLRESVDEGGRFIFSSSNNADFGMTDESVQQLDFARIRAIEYGRAVVNVSTVGITATIASDGTVEQRLPWYTPGYLIADVPLSDTMTPASVSEQYTEFAAGGIGVALLLGAGLSARADAGDSGRSRRKRRRDA